ncbi:hypothetical protein SASPL_111844 [Salvia splendens]|uniref:Uncharacterized protein n=1 Tax=Salvia splendens TaxID=180675 RepID=A0A8X8Y800_SALSN|nr:hypothetical protein SASPL_111844 [Salvia splendens]
MCGGRAMVMVDEQIDIGGDDVAVIGSVVESEESMAVILTPWRESSRMDRVSPGSKKRRSDRRAPITADSSSLARNERVLGLLLTQAGQGHGEGEKGDAFLLLI